MQIKTIDEAKANELIQHARAAVEMLKVKAAAAKQKEKAKAQADDKAVEGSDNAEIVDNATDTAQDAAPESSDAT